MRTESMYGICCYWGRLVVAKRLGPDMLRPDRTLLMYVVRVALYIIRLIRKTIKVYSNFSVTR